MTFEEWWEKWQKDTEQVFFSYERSFAEEAWDYQQARIEALENVLRCIGDYAAGASARHSGEFTVSRFDEIEHRCKAALLQE